MREHIYRRGRTCWHAGHCHTLDVLPESPERKSSFIRWVTLVVEQDVLQSQGLLDRRNVNSPVQAVESGTFTVVDELDTLVGLCEAKSETNHAWPRTGD